MTGEVHARDGPPAPLAEGDTLLAAIDAAAASGHADAVAFLRELVRMPTDTPPGDNAAAAEGTARLIETMGWTVERHPVPAAETAAAGLKSITNLVVRRRYVLGYTSTNPKRDGGWRQVVVGTRVPGITIRSAGGYYAPSAAKPLREGR